MNHKMYTSDNYGFNIMTKYKHNKYMLDNLSKFIIVKNVSIVVGNINNFENLFSKKN